MVILFKNVFCLDIIGLLWKCPENE
uniref:Uncharacterized protein n=1 Tax=Anguilla anguilla TaxID=7936 RepID=A0A0E9VC46_ANGAN